MATRAPPSTATGNGAPAWTATRPVTYAELPQKAAWPKDSRPVTSCPCSRIAPDVGVRKPVSRLNSVVLPAPLGPTRACTEPAATRRSTESTARKPENSFVSPRVSRTTSGRGRGPSPPARRAASSATPLLPTARCCAPGRLGGVRGFCSSPITTYGRCGWRRTTRGPSPPGVRQPGTVRFLDGRCRAHPGGAHPGADPPGRRARRRPGGRPVAPARGPHPVRPVLAGTLRIGAGPGCSSPGPARPQHRAHRFDRRPRARRQAGRRRAGHRQRDRGHRRVQRSPAPRRIRAAGP